MSIHVLCPFFNQILFILTCVSSFFVVVVSSLYILDINPLLHILFANIFSHLVGGLFILLMVSFTVPKLLSLCCPICLFLVLFPWPEETDPAKIFLRPMSKSILPMFSSRSFIVSGLTFKSLIYFEFFFCIWCKKVVQFHSFACSCPVSQHNLLKRLSFFHCILLAPLS